MNLAETLWCGSSAPIAARSPEWAYPLGWKAGTEAFSSSTYLQTHVQSVILLAYYHPGVQYPAPHIAIV